MEELQFKPDNHLVWSILTTIFCCLPLGIVSIVYASKVNEYYVAGNYEGAKDAADKAKQFAIISAIVGGVAIIASIIYYVVVFAATYASILG